MADTAPRRLHGVIVLGRQSVAIDIEAIREVVPCPPRLLPFPALVPAVVGAIDLRGTMVPVLDPTLLPGFSTTRDERQSDIVTVLRHGGRMFGVLTRAILGVADLDAQGAMRPLTINASDTSGAIGTIVTASFMHGG